MLNRPSSDGKIIVDSPYPSPHKNDSIAITSTTTHATAATETTSLSLPLLPSPKPASRSSSSSSTASSYYPAVQQVTPYSTYAGMRYSGDNIVTTDTVSNNLAPSLSPSTTKVEGQNRNDHSKNNSIDDIAFIERSPESPLSPPILGTTSTGFLRERQRSSIVSSGNSNRNGVKTMNPRASIHESLGRPMDMLCVDVVEGLAKQNEYNEKERREVKGHQELYLSKERLEKTCDSLRRQRDNIVSEIKDYITQSIPTSRQVLFRLNNDNNEDANVNNSNKQQQLLDQLRQSFDEQLKSIQEDIQIAKTEYTKLLTQRNEIMNEMVLLNTKNAELNEMNNNLSLRVSQRERETVAFMAGTNFLDDQDKKPSPRSKKSYNASSPIIMTASPTTKKSTNDDEGGGGSGGISKIKKLKNSRFKFGKFSNNNGSGGGSRSSPNNENSSTKHFQISGSESTGVILDDAASIISTATTDSSYFPVDVYEGQHNLYQTKSLRPVRCEVCGDKIWRSSEAKCQGCGLACHLRCMRNLPQECLNNKKSGSNNEYGQRSLSIQSISKSSIVFGNDLSKLVQMENSTVPLIVRRCVEAVEIRGMELEGIYRKSGGAKQMREIQDLFDRGQPPDLTDDNQWNDINAVTSVLKQYFRKLPDPLFTYQLHHEFIKNTYIKNPSIRFSEIQILIHKLLPPENRDTIQYIMRHLYRVQKRSDTNFMNIRNLAVIFGPTLLRNMDEASDLLEMSRKIEMIDYILNHYESIFGC